MKVSGVLESCLYAADLDAAQRFYSNTLGLELVSAERKRHVFFRCGPGMLLLFNPDHTSTEQSHVGGSPVPLHGSRGAGHLAFAASEDELPQWRESLSRAGVAIESEVSWPGGGQSIYFRDPAGNSLEIATPKMWGL